jgi:hypothetical protein
VQDFGVVEVDGELGSELLVDQQRWYQCDVGLARCINLRQVGMYGDHEPGDRRHRYGTLPLVLRRCLDLAGGAMTTTTTTVLTATPDDRGIGMYLSCRLPKGWSGRAAGQSTRRWSRGGNRSDWGNLLVFAAFRALPLRVAGASLGSAVHPEEAGRLPQ